MPAVEGQIFGEVPAFDERLKDAAPETNAAFHSMFLDLVADINRIDWRGAGLDGIVPRRNNAAEIAHWRHYLAWYADGEVIVPALVEALNWCEDNQPSHEPDPSLCWGDVRIENMIVDDDRRLVAVLDWEMATIGAAEHDLAWALTLEATQEELMSRTVPGFLDHDAALSRYEERLGRRVVDLDWYEVLAALRSTAIMSRIAHLNDQRGEPNFFPIADNPVLDILARRIEEAS
jgi:aminoglycoside phosphotransferase (APT) family kinase protein